MAEAAPAAPSRHAQYGEHWGEGAARCFSIDADLLDEDHAVRLMPVPDSFVCPISTTIMIDPVATVDGCIYERQYIERWFRERRQQGHRITSPVTGLELPSATLMPLVALQRAIEAYLAHRPELKREHMAGRSFEEAAQMLQTDLFEKQAVHATAQDKLRRLKQANKALEKALQDAEARIRRLEAERPLGSLPDSEARPARPAKAPRRLLDGRGLVLCALLFLVLGSCFSIQLWRGQEPPPPLVANTPQEAPAADVGARAQVRNPAFATQLQQLRTGSLEAKQQAAFMLRIFAAEHVENQAALADAGAVQPLVALLQEPTPSLREEAARALWNLARSNKEINVRNQVAIGRSGAIPPLTRLLDDPAPRVRVVAAAVLNDLAADNSENQVSMAHAGIMAPLIRILRSDEAPALVMAANLLRSLASGAANGAVSHALTGAVAPLVALLKADTLLAQEQAAAALGALAACSRQLQLEVARAGAVPPLVERLRGDMMQGTAAQALRNLASGLQENQVAIAEAGAIVPLIRLLQDGMPGVQEDAAGALWNLAAGNLQNQLAIVRAGAAVPLVALLKGEAQEEATLQLLHLAG